MQHRDVNSESLGFAFIQQRAKAGGKAGICSFCQGKCHSMSFLLVVGFGGSLALGTRWQQHVELEGPAGISSSLRR